eukprot:CAMPEP_0175880956 /NCGR_PEP_ID=MMETSP0107_2-20121207/42618_1 /TAXON_ID=195067 ORGANISM="Goniomonas pacifica, Strain CCMP1869" /NCGR_SAMPLE_ID=MMETSP0107_2 /ASSEMBLY_ACC=CAM_ASM_000203 /LENGTH=159 /DNA_ID=CAMNT_0017200783 /DNA_START=140 /DNA_END=615 /DNA_ORIENTATION=+
MASTRSHYRSPGDPSLSRCVSTASTWGVNDAVATASRVSAAANLRLSSRAAGAPSDVAPPHAPEPLLPIPVWLWVDANGQFHGFETTGELGKLRGVCLGLLVRMCRSVSTCFKVSSCLRCLSSHSPQGDFGCSWGRLDAAASAATAASLAASTSRSSSR